MHRFILYILIFFLPSLGLTKPLIIGTNAEYPPYIYIEDNNIVGFDADLAQYISKKLSREIIFKDMPFDALILQLKLNKIDMIIAGLTSTPAREKQVSFSDSYLIGDELVIVSKEKKYDVASLANSTICVNEGYTADLYITNNYNNLNVVRLNSPADAFLALDANRCHNFVTAHSTVKDFQKKSLQASFFINSIPETQEGCAVAVNKDNIELLEKLNQVISEMQVDGSLVAMKNKWGI